MYAVENAKYVKSFWMIHTSNFVTPAKGIQEQYMLLPVLDYLHNSGIFTQSIMIYRTTDQIYGTYDGLFGKLLAMFGLQNTYDERLAFDSKDYIKIDHQDEIAYYLNMKILWINYSPAFKVIERQPLTIVDAISRLGGILAIINIGFIIEMINEGIF